VDKITFGSFPRSANNFFYKVLQDTISDERFDCILHYMEPLNTAQNIVTTIRSPLECVPSWITFTNDTRPNRTERVLEWYCSYYEKCVEVNTLIFKFEDVISRPMDCVTTALEIYKLPPPVTNQLDLDFSTDFHSPTKDKSKYDLILDEMKVAPNLQKALSIYSSAKTHSFDD